MSNVRENAHEHGLERLCGAGDLVYARALAEGRIAREAAAEAPCLIDLALLHPDPVDPAWLVPARPGEVISRLMREVRADVDAAQRRVSGVTAAVERLAGFGGGGGATGVGFRVLEGFPRISLALDEATEECTTELLNLQPGGIRREFILKESLHRARDLERRDIPIRSLYTHVARHGQSLYGYLEAVGRLTEIRTLDQVTERLIIFDRTVAFLPANADRTNALEVRQPAVVEYLAGVFEWLWYRGIPLTEQVPPQSPVEGVTRREHAIAALLAEGLADADVARRLGLNIRTCRHHIARLAEALGSSSRAQLGVLIARAGLDVPPDREV